MQALPLPPDALLRRALVAAAAAACPECCPLHPQRSSLRPARPHDMLWCKTGHSEGCRQLKSCI
jgi:hypothetical protein